MAQSDTRTPPLSDFQCWICLEILVEPVTLPCKHTLCKPCFQSSLEKATLRCPFCRAWISSWARHHARQDALVNTALWEEIQTHYPRECRDRLRGQSSAVFPEAAQPERVLSEPGELRQEYEQEMRKMEAELRARQEEESRASLDYIQKLLAREREEKMAQAEQLRLEMRQKLRRPGLDPGPEGASSACEEHSRNTQPVASKKHKAKRNHVENVPKEAPPSSLLERSMPPPPGTVPRSSRDGGPAPAATGPPRSSPPATPRLHPDMPKPRPEPPAPGLPAGPTVGPQGQATPNAFSKQLAIVLTRLPPELLGSAQEAALRPGQEGSGPSKPSRGPKAAKITAEREGDPPPGPCTHTVSSTATRASSEVAREPGFSCTK